MNKRRLLKLADLLEADAKNKKGIKFDMGNWGTIGNPQKPLSCGTTACAMGLAAISGAFKRAGLGYEVHDHELYVTMNGEDDGVSSAMVLFDISRAEAEALFIYTSGEGAEGERKVAKSIRNFVKTGVTTALG